MSRSRGEGLEYFDLRPIDRSSPLPFYYQLQGTLRDEIDRGRWKPGELLPSEAELSEIFGVSRTVIRQSLDLLESDGEIRRVKGKGTLVSGHRQRYQAIAAAAVTRGKSSGRDGQLLTVVSCDEVPVEGRVGRLLGLTRDARVFELMFIQGVDRVPASISQLFLRQDASPQIAQLAEGEATPILVEGGPDTFSQLRRQYGLEIVHSEVTIETTEATENESILLGIPPGASCYMLTSMDWGVDRKPLGFSRSVIRSDTFRFAFRIDFDLPDSRDERGAILGVGGVLFRHPVHQGLPNRSVSRDRDATWGARYSAPDR